MQRKAEKFFRIISNYKKALIFVFLFCLIFVLFPLDSVQAFSLFGDIGGAIAESFIAALAGFIGFFLNVVGTITGAILAFACWILNWVISDGFISLSYTNPAKNPFISIGWTLLRDLTNIIFVVALIAIGLGTALRITGYHAKKALPTLIIIALLVNFTPVICGLIVDAANIVMNFFLQGAIGWDNFANMVLAMWTSWMQPGTTPEFWDPLSGDKIGGREAISIATGAAAIIVYNLIATFLIAIYTFLFIIRYIAIWTLVILSPIAFASYILPPTRGLFNMWWKQFLQWSIIGIVMAFFLYLANRLIILMYEEVLQSSDYISPTTGTFSGLLNEILPWGIVVVLMLLGLFIGLSSGAMGATAIINVSKKGTRWAGRTMATTAAGAVRGIPAVSKAEATARRRLERIPLLGRAIGGPGALETERGKRIKGAADSLEKIPDTTEGNRAIVNLISRTALTDQDRYKRAAGIEVLAKRKELPDEVKSFVPEAQRLGADTTTIYKARPDFAPKLTTIDSVTHKPRAMTTEEAMKKIEPGQFWQKVQKEALRDADVAIHAALDQRKFDQMTRHLRAERKAEFKNTLFNPAKISSRPLTRQERKVIDKRVKFMSTDPRWRV